MHTSSSALRARNAALMHPRNRYKDRPPDFAALARADAAFARLLLPGGQLDWSSPQALTELCRVLLWHDFGVRWELPPDRLCPTVPSRLNYLLWLEDLLALPGTGGGGGGGASEETSRSATAAPPPLGVDIGTGASCIYPLLGVAQLGWRFIATEIDPVSVGAARRNVSLNGWEQSIDVRAVAAPVEGAGQSSEEAPLLLGVLRPDERVAFCMCNPPFYDEAETPPAPAAQHAPCTASHSEQFAPGGEVGFVLRLVRESQQLGTQVGWYSSLLGRKASLRPLLSALRKARAPRVRTTELSQGVTLRWVVAWSFAAGGDGAADAVAAAAADGGGAAAAAAVPERRAKTFRVRKVAEEEVRARVASFLAGGGASSGASSAGAEEDGGRMGGADGDDPRGNVVLAQGRVACKRRAATAAAVDDTDGAAADEGFAFEVRLVRLLRPEEGDHAGGEVADGEGEPPDDGIDVQVLLSEGQGAAAAAFWLWADRLRNDVVRDTRKWRRLAASSAGQRDGT